MAEQEVHEGDAPAAQPNIDPQMAMFSHHFHELQIELRAQGVFSQIRVFLGEGNKRFQEWVRDMERARVTLRADDHRMQVLALQSLGGQAAEFCTGLARDGQQLTWEELKRKLKERYSDMADMLYARKSLRHLKQRKGESVQNFHDRLMAVAVEAFQDLDLRTDIIQQQLIEVFVDGLLSDSVARKLIKCKPDTVQGALEIAMEDQQTTRSFNLRRGPSTEVEPMDMDVVESGSDRLTHKGSDRLNTIEQIMQGLTNQVSALHKQLGNGQTHTPHSSAGPGNRGYSGGASSQLRPHQGRGSNVPPGRVFLQQPHNQGPRRGPPRWSADGPSICLRCSWIGHMIRECRQAPAQSPQPRLKESNPLNKGRMGRKEHGTNVPENQIHTIETNTPVCTIRLGERRIEALIDSAADISIASMACLRTPKKAMSQISPKIQPTPVPALVLPSIN